MIDLLAWDVAQSEQLHRLRDAEAEASVLQQLLMTSCLLELSKIAASQPELVLFVQSTVDLIAQFFPIEGCRLEVHPAGLPAVTASFGATDETTLSFPLTAGGTALGTLSTSGIPSVLGGSQFFGRIAEHVATCVTSVAEAERPRRLAAAANAARLVASLEDWRDEPWLDELVAALAMLPDALGAELTVDGPNAGAPITLRAGLIDPAPVERRRAAAGDVTVDLAMRWSALAEERNRAAIDRLWDDLVAAVGRAEERRHLQDDIDTDALTGVANRRRAIRSLAAVLRRAERRGEDVAVLMLDLDRFDDLIDSLGHGAGDAVLRAVAAMLVREAPGGEVARMAQTRFMIVLPGTDLLAAGEHATRLRRLVPPACADVLPEVRRQTASLGVAVYPPSAGFPDALVREADRALYEAKAKGPDQVAVATAGSDHPVRL